ncbi:putative metal-binding motif-containing protein [Pyxidicoccus parkwayensis]|uniref:putative metal-binding motif-containing protein n=1 Tax=Pyxidicoccus parkwayensis TaxID=2813578 RepID=UPI001F513A19|nr:putative metal-binding motif-containing protein [Pyxidicoccus parkwaysis]
MPTQPSSPWYPDDDGDGYGRGSGAVLACAAPKAYVNQGNDCDDGNPFNHPNGTEICDGLDNDCDNQPEVASTGCPNGGPTWNPRTEGSLSQLWHSVFTWTPGGVWVVGDNNRRAVMRPGDTGFTVTTGGCETASTVWSAVWADPATNGRAYFVSDAGRLSRQEASSTDCTQVTETGMSDMRILGITGVRNGSALELYGVSTNTMATQGAAFFWDGASPTVTFNSATNPVGPMFGIHGVSRDTLFAVGFENSPPVSRIYRFNTSNGQWVTQNVQGPAGGAIGAHRRLGGER